jgi:hypothetical protein
MRRRGAGQRGSVNAGFGRWSESLLVCNSANRDVAIDNLGAYGSKVLSVSGVNIDAVVLYEIGVTIGNQS